VVKRLLIPLGIALLCAGGQASAQDWTGFYLGAHAGGVWANEDWTDVDLTTEPVSFEPSGIMGGGQIGAQMMFQSFVLGVEGTFSGAGVDANADSVVVPGVVTYSTDIDMMATAVGRLGFAYGSFMPYLKGGYAGAHLTTAGENTGIPDAFTISDWEHGWTVGGGIEYTWNNFIFGADYGYVNLGDFNRSGTTDTGIPFTVTGIESRIHTMNARISFLFGGMQ
jgi:outer membrane immunogenic protein